MAAEIKNENGLIRISNAVIAKIAGYAATKCYGVVGMASKQVLKDGWAELLNKENYSRGVRVKETENGLDVDLYIIACFGVKISEAVKEAQKKVKYVLEKTLTVDVNRVNVFVQGVRVNN